MVCTRKKPCAWTTRPRPPQYSQVCGLVPGGAPVPWQVPHCSRRRTSSVRLQPCAASSNSILISLRRWLPRWALRPATAVAEHAEAFEQVAEGVENIGNVE